VQAAVDWLVHQDDDEEVSPECTGSSANSLAIGGATPLVTSHSSQCFTTQSAGVAGILRREQQVAAKTDRCKSCAPENHGELHCKLDGILDADGLFRLFCNRALEQAFADLRGLMTKASEMVQLAQHFRQTLADRTGSDGMEWMDADMEAELVNIGINSPVTKAAAGAFYHQELSKQVLSRSPFCVTHCLPAAWDGAGTHVDIWV
jgi:hypothetical protein